MEQLQRSSTATLQTTDEGRLQHIARASEDPLLMLGMRGSSQVGAAAAGAP